MYLRILPNEIGSMQNILKTTGKQNNPWLTVAILCLAAYALRRNTCGAYTLELLTPLLAEQRPELKIEVVRVIGTSQFG